MNLILIRKIAIYMVFFIIIGILRMVHIVNDPGEKGVFFIIFFSLRSGVLNAVFAYMLAIFIIRLFINDPIKRMYFLEIFPLFFSQIVILIFAHQLTFLYNNFYLHIWNIIKNVFLIIYSKAFLVYIKVI